MTTYPPEIPDPWWSRPAALLGVLLLVSLYIAIPAGAIALVRLAFFRSCP